MASAVKALEDLSQDPEAHWMAREREDKRRWWLTFAFGVLFYACQDPVSSKSDFGIAAPDEKASRTEAEGGVDAADVGDSVGSTNGPPVPPITAEVPGDSPSPTAVPSAPASSVYDGQGSGGTADMDPSAGDEGVATWCIAKLLQWGGGCFYEVPDPPIGQTIDTESINLRLAGYSGDTVLDEPIARVSNAEACTGTELEWYYRDDNPWLVLCPNTCTAGEQGGQGRLWIRAGCL